MKKSGALIIVILSIIILLLMLFTHSLEFVAGKIIFVFFVGILVTFGMKVFERH